VTFTNDLNVLVDRYSRTSPVKIKAAHIALVAEVNACRMATINRGAGDSLHPNNKFSRRVAATD